jgi:hypothetical protein
MKGQVPATIKPRQAFLFVARRLQWFTVHGLPLANSFCFAECIVDGLSIRYLIPYLEDAIILEYTFMYTVYFCTQKT